MKSLGNMSVALLSNCPMRSCKQVNRYGMANIDIFGISALKKMSRNEIVTFIFRINSFIEPNFWM